MSHVPPAAHRSWFGLLGAHGDPKRRLLCIGAVLLFLAFPLSDLLSGRLARGSEVVAAIGLAAFAALYVRLFWILPSIGSERRSEDEVLAAATRARPDVALLDIEMPGIGPPSGMDSALRIIVAWRTVLAPAPRECTLAMNGWRRGSAPSRRCAARRLTDGPASLVERSAMQSAPAAMRTIGGHGTC